MLYKQTNSDNKKVVTEILTFSSLYSAKSSGGKSKENRKGVNTECDLRTTY